MDNKYALIENILLEAFGDRYLSPAQEIEVNELNHEYGWIPLKTLISFAKNDDSDNFYDTKQALKYFDSKYNSNEMSRNEILNILSTDIPKDVVADIQNANKNMIDPKLQLEFVQRDNSPDHYIQNKILSQLYSDLKRNKLTLTDLEDLLTLPPSEVNEKLSIYTAKSLDNDLITQFKDKDASKNKRISNTVILRLKRMINNNQLSIDKQNEILTLQPDEQLKKLDNQKSDQENTSFFDKKQISTFQKQDRSKTHKLANSIINDLISLVNKQLISKDEQENILLNSSIDEAYNIVKEIENDQLSSKSISEFINKNKKSFDTGYLYKLINALSGLIKNHMLSTIEQNELLSLEPSKLENKLLAIKTNKIDDDLIKSFILKDTSEKYTYSKKVVDELQKLIDTKEISLLQQEDMLKTLTPKEAYDELSLNTEQQISTIRLNKVLSLFVKHGKPDNEAIKKFIEFVQKQKKDGLSEEYINNELKAMAKVLNQINNPIKVIDILLSSTSFDDFENKLEIEFFGDSGALNSIFDILLPVEYGKLYSAFGKMLELTKHEFELQAKKGYITSKKTGQYIPEMGLSKIFELWANKEFKFILRPQDVKISIGYTDKKSPIYSHKPEQLVGFVYNAEYYYGPQRKNLATLNMSNLANIEHIITDLQNSKGDLKYLQSILRIVAIYNYNDLLENQEYKKFDDNLLNYDVYVTTLDLRQFKSIKDFYELFVNKYIINHQSKFLRDIRLAMQPDPEKVKQIKQLRDQHGLQRFVNAFSLDQKSFEPYEKDNGDIGISRTEYDED